MSKSLNVILGRYDDPENQCQDNYCVDLYKTNLAIFGSAMSGKTSLLKMLLMQLHQQVASLVSHEEIYILDFSNGLSKYKELPLVDGYLEAAHEENIRRMFRIAEEKLSENIRNLKGQSFRGPNDKITHVTLVLDGVNIFLDNERLHTYHEQLKRLARDGISKGITVVMTASEISGNIRRLLPSFKRIIALDLPKDTYGELFNARAEKPLVLKGRGVANMESKVYEFQAYLPFDPTAGSQGDEDVEEKAIGDIAEWYSFAGCPIAEYVTQGDSPRTVGKKMSGTRYIVRIISNAEALAQRHERKLKNFDEKLERNDAWKKYTGMTWKDYVSAEDRLTDENDSGKHRHTLGDFTAGIDYYSFKPVKFNLKEALTIAIYGKKQFGKSNLLSMILDAAHEIDPDAELILWDDGRKGLTRSKIVSRSIGRYDESWDGTECSTDKIHFVSNVWEFEKLLLGKSLDVALDKDEYAEPKTMDEDVFAEDFEINEDFPLEFVELEEKAIPDSMPLQQIPQEHPFTIVVIQSRQFYQSSTFQSEMCHLIPRLAAAVNNAQDKMLFVFSDVQRIAANDLRTQFNNCINHAFLLDDIVRFIKDKGSQSVFGMQDIDEMKERFGPCELGDGFYLNVQADEIQKLKFISAESEEER